MARRTARSFALSLRLLPAATRDEITLAYLLARTTDTVADAPGLPAAERLVLLDALGAMVRGEEAGGDDEVLPVDVGTPGERELMRNFPSLIEALHQMDEEAQGRIRRVLGVIVSGQILDIRRFEVERLRVLPDEAALVDYTFRVAGCVGRFWTEVLAGRCPESLRRPAESMAEMGVRYGQGLQLLNILRDAPEDWKRGRCYLPWRGAAGESAAEAPPALFEVMRSWLPKCREWLDEGERYGRSLRGRRLRAATVLPARIGQETWAALAMAERAAWLGRVKVPRGRVRWMVLRALLIG